MQVRQSALAKRARLRLSLAARTAGALLNKRAGVRATCRGVLMRRHFPLRPTRPSRTRQAATGGKTKLMLGVTLSRVQADS
jgi:hypothetical protein